MNSYPELTDWQNEFIAIRHDFHAHPELSFEEFRTSDIVVEKLRDYGVDNIHRGLGGTGVVATITGKHALRNDRTQAIALRMDMDALPIQEETNLPYKSKFPGKMHACGHDGHTTILLMTAKYLAKHRNFAGAVYLIFQPAEENGPGARKMIEDGLFSLFPAESVWGMHNWPAFTLGSMHLCAGPILACSEEIKITIQGQGAHAASPHLAKDPMIAAAQLIQAAQTIISRTLDPFEQAVVSLCTIHGGIACNVIPDCIEMTGTVRTFSPEVRASIHTRLTDICNGIAIANDLLIKLDVCTDSYPAVINSKNEAQFATQIAQEVYGAEHVNAAMRPMMGGEDFSFMLQQKPGAYVLLGSAKTQSDPSLHQNTYDFNDAAISLGASYFIKLVEEKLKAD